MVYRTPNIRLSLEPRVIRSIIESSGMDHAAIAQKMGVDKERVDGWARTGAIEYPRVRALAKCVRRSETLFLRTVPLKSEKMPDFRMMPGAPEWLDADDLPTVRRVRYMHSAAREMMDAGGIAAGPRIPAGIAVGSDAGEAAALERARLAVDCRADGTPRGSADKIYSRLRAAIEEANILVFQYPLVTKGVRGLSLAGPSAPCAILVNSREIAPARSFTLLHEYGHVLLGRGGVCDEHGAMRPNSDKGRAEAWCNRLAASLLMPEAPFAAEMAGLEARTDDPLLIVEELAGKFKTSRFAAAVRAAGLSGGDGGAGPAYGGALQAIAGNHSRRQCPGGKDGDVDGARPPCLDVLVSRLGKKFIRLALSSHESGIITSRDLGDYLGMSLVHLDKLVEKVPPNE